MSNRSIPIDLSLVVPCLNEEAAIPLFYEEAVKMLDALMQSGQISVYEFIFMALSHFKWV
ncbi:hypothetical protein AGMMS49938_07680 [Fibrobacterales bacterium]|nr:hypothetical protein AGMMS49938_07680 [Fibrobacterales bacterium]